MCESKPSFFLLFSIFQLFLFSSIALANPGEGPVSSPASVEVAADTCREYNAEEMNLWFAELKADGHSLHLIIGRTQAEEINRYLPELRKKGVWVFGDKIGSAAIAEFDGIPFKLDFDNPDCLKKISDGVFDEIIFDGSTWRFFHNGPQVLPQFARILKSGGKLFLERPSTPRSLLEFREGDELAYDADPIAHHLIIPTSVIGDRVRLRATIALGNREIDRRYQANYTSLGFSDLILVSARSSDRKKYPIPTNYYPDYVDFYEFIK